MSQALLAVFSHIIGGKVSIVSPTEERSVRGHKITVNDIFQSSFNRLSYSASNDHSERDFSVFVSLSCKTITLPVSISNTIQDIKEMIEIKEGIPAHTFRLRSMCTELGDECTVADAGIIKDQTLIALPRLVGGACPFVQEVHSDVFTLSSLDLASSFDYDFTHRADDGKKYIRGGYMYQRPYGWYRNALNVVGKYDNDDWFGPNGIRTHSVRGEWPVAYHGTASSRSHAVVGKIFREGFKAGSRKKYGYGIYASPSLTMVADVYANKFVHNDGKTYQYAFQTRVNPNCLEVIKNGYGDADYWLLPDNSKAVRPYGILTREIK